MKFVKVVKSRKGLSPKRYNEIFDHRHNWDKLKEQILRENGVEETEIMELAKNTGLSKDALGEKVREMGLWDELCNRSDKNKIFSAAKGTSVKKYNDTELNKILDKFKEEYTFLYDNNDNVAGYNDAVNAYDFYRTNEDFMELVRALVRKRHDVFSSDREVGALMFALESLGYLEKIDNAAEQNKFASLKKKAYDDSEEDLDSFDYTYSLLVNGNITDYKEKLNKMTKKELVNYINWANEMGIDISKLSLRYITANKKVSKIVSKKSIKSGESYGWVVNPEDAQEKLQLWIDTVGAEAALDDIAKAMGTDELSSCLAFIFRNNDFREGCSDYEPEDEENSEDR